MKPNGKQDPREQRDRLQDRGYVTTERGTTRRVLTLLITSIIIGGGLGFAIGRSFSASHTPTVPVIKVRVSPPPSATNPDDLNGSVEVAITEPTDQQTLPRVLWTKGTFSGLPGDRKIRVVVHPYGTNRWFPQEAPSMDGGTEGSWEVLTHIGLPGLNDEGKWFDIAAVAVDDQTADMLDEHIGEQGIQLDATFYSRVMVKRTGP